MVKMAIRYILFRMIGWIRIRIGADVGHGVRKSGIDERAVVVTGSFTQILSLVDQVVEDRIKSW